MKQKCLLIILVSVALFSSCNSNGENIKEPSFSINGENHYKKWIDKALEFNKDELNKVEDFGILKNKMRIVKFSSYYLENEVNAITFITYTSLNNKTYFMEFQVNDYGNLVLPVSIYEENTLNLEEKPEFALFSDEIASLDFNYLTSKLERRESKDSYVFRYLGESILTGEEFPTNGLLFSKGKYLNKTEFMDLDEPISVMNFHLTGSMNDTKNNIFIYIDIN